MSADCGSDLAMVHYARKDQGKANAVAYGMNADAIPRVQVLAI